MKLSSFPKLSFYSLLFLFIVTLNRCDCKLFDDSVSSKFGVIKGIVTTLQQSPLADVKIRVGEIEIYSDDQGKFTLDKVPVGMKQVIHFTLGAYAPTQKTADIIENEIVTVTASLKKWDTSSAVDVSQANTVSFQNASVKLPASGLVNENGQTVSGTVTVSASYFDPTDPNYAEVFPGDFEGEDVNGNTVPIESFGFISVEITQGSNSLNLAAGEVSEIKIPVVGTLLNNAPPSIPLWFFDEELGTWVEEGSATLQNGAYVGNVGHFSSWNADKAMETSIIKGKVKCKDGSPIPNAKVIARGINYSGTTTTRTATDGSYEIPVKSDAEVEITAFYVLPGEVIPFGQSPSVRTTTAPALQSKTIQDLLIDCDPNNVSYTWYNDVVITVLGASAIAVGENGITSYFDPFEDIWINVPAATTESFYGVTKSSWNYFWAVGSNGTVGTLDDDVTVSWDPVFIGTDAHLNDIEFFDGYHGWICGTTGKIFRTVDGGNNWTPEISGTVQTLHAMTFVSREEGWLCGTVSGTNGIILHTTDGGISWQTQNSGVPENLKGIKFTDPDNGWAVGENGVIVHSSNGGQLWQKQASGTLEDLQGIDFYEITGSNGIIVGENEVVLSTSDGGNSWSKMTEFYNPNPVDNYKDVDMIQLPSDSLGFIIASDKLLRSKIKGPASDYGWSLQTSGVNDTLWAVEAVSETEVWAAGNKAIIHTINSGNSWAQIQGITEDIYTIDKVADNIWAGGDNVLYKSTDNGLNWSKINGIPQNRYVLKVKFINSQFGWMITDMFPKISNEGSLEREIYTSNDGGLNWIMLNGAPGGQNNRYIDIEMITKDKVYVIYYDDVQQELILAKTLNGGMMWNKQNLACISVHKWMVAGISVLNNDQVFVSADDVLHTSYNDLPAYGMEVPQIYRSNAVEFTSEYKGWILGDAQVSITKNGGRSWKNQILGSNNPFNFFTDLDMVNDQVGWVVGKDGIIYHTTTGGK